MVGRHDSAARRTPPCQRPSADDLAADAEAERAPIAAADRRHPDIDVVDSYEIQLLNIRRASPRAPASTATRSGLSSKAMQEMMGVDEPDYGHLLDDMEVFEDQPVEAGRYLLPAGRGRGGLRPRRGPAGRGLHRGRRAGRDGAFAPAIELIDSRIPDWKIKISDTDRRQRLVGRVRARPRAGAAQGRRPQDHRRRARPQRRGGRPRAAATRCSATRSPRWPGWPARSRRFGVAARSGAT